MMHIFSSPHRALPNSRDICCMRHGTEHHSSDIQVLLKSYLSQLKILGLPMFAKPTKNKKVI